MKYVRLICFYFFDQYLIIGARYKYSFVNVNYSSGLHRMYLCYGIIFPPIFIFGACYKYSLKYSNVFMKYVRLLCFYLFDKYLIIGARSKYSIALLVFNLLKISSLARERKNRLFLNVLLIYTLNWSFIITILFV